MSIPSSSSLHIFTASKNDGSRRRKRKQVFPKSSKSKSSFSATTSFEDEYSWEMENIADWQNRSHGWSSKNILPICKDTSLNEEWPETTGATPVQPTASGPKRPKVQNFPPKMTSGENTPLRLPSVNEAEPVKVQGMIGFLEGHRLAHC